jgi:predicted dehydrogenase
MPLTVGLCGLGSAATRAHLPALSRAEETGAAAVVAVCGARPDLLVIASPPSAHLGAITAAVERGVDVLCEKPLGLSASDVAQLQDLSAAHPSRLIAPVHQYRLAPPWRVFNRALTVAAARECAFRLDCEVERPGTDPLSAGGWRADPDHEGGILGDHAVHYLALCWETGLPVRMAGCERSGDGGSETARSELRMGRGTATVTVSYAGHARRNRIALDIPAAGFHLDWHDESLTVTRRGGPGSVRRVGALSARQFVNDLYDPLYDELLARIDDRCWRAERTAETVGVAALLAESLELATTAS